MLTTTGNLRSLPRVNRDRLHQDLRGDASFISASASGILDINVSAKTCESHTCFYTGHDKRLSANQMQPRRRGRAPSPAANPPTSSSPPRASDASPAEPKRPRRGPASSPIALPRLPTELWDIVLSFVPLMARLRVVTLVCKRWHQTAMRNITCLGPRMTFNALTRFTNLTAVHIGSETSWSVPQGVQLPPLPLLDLDVHSKHLDRFGFASGLTRLVGEPNARFCTLLSANATSLRRLELVWDSGFCINIPVQRFSSLTSLRLAMKAPCYQPHLLPLWSELVKVYAPRLRRLDLCLYWNGLAMSVSPSDFVADVLTLPCPVSLEWHVSYHRVAKWNPDAPIWTHLADTAHLITALYVYFSPQILQNTDALATLTTVIAQCTRLRHLSLPGMQPMPKLFCSVATQLTTLSCLVPWQSLKELPHLRVVSCKPVSLSAFLSLPMLASLRELTLDIVTWRLPAEEALLAQLEACPRLVSVMLTVGTLDRERLERHKTALKAAEQRGVELLRFSTTDRRRARCLPANVWEAYARGFLWMRLLYITPMAVQ